MIILLHGPDTFRSQRKRNELIAAYRSKYAGGLSESFFSDEDFSFRAFEEHARGNALFSTKRLIVLNDISQHKTALREVEAYLKKNDVTASRDVFMLCWESRDLQKIKEAAFLLNVASPTQTFPFLQGNAFRTWLLKTADQMGVRFAPAGLDIFLSWHAGDSWRAVCDMEKLHTYVRGKTIQAADVEQLCIRPTELAIFRTLELLFNRKSAEAFAALEKHMQSGEDVFYLFKMFGYQLRLVALVKEKLEAGGGALPRGLSITGVHPYALQKTVPLARSMSWGKLNKLFSSLYRSDEAIKQGTADAMQCLEMFAYDVACV